MAKFKSPEEFFAGLGNDETKVNVENVEDVEKEFESPEEEEVVNEEGAETTKEESQEELAEQEQEEGDEQAEEQEESLEVEAQEPEEEDGIIFEDEEEDAPKSLDLSVISNELGFGEVKTKEDLISKYNEALAKAKEDALEGVPAELKEAIAFAKEGGDYIQLLDVAKQDYDQFTNTELVKTSVEKYFKNDDGTLDSEGLEDWYSSKSKAEINIMGDQIREKLKMEQATKLNEIRAKAEREKEASRKELKSHIDALSSIGGVKLRSSDKEKLYNDTVAGTAMEELFYENGRISEKKLAENLFKIRSFEKAISLAKASSKNEGKREVIQKATNSTVNKPQTKPKAESKKYDPIEELMNFAKNRK